MRSFAVASFVLAALPAAFGLTINTPTNLVQCQPIQIAWADGQAPFFVSVFPGGQSSGALKSFDQQDGTSLTWLVDIAANTEVTLGVTDGTGVQAYSSPVTIRAGSTTDCSSSVSGSQPSGSATGSGSGSSPSATSGGSNSASGSSSGSAASPSQSDNAAPASGPLSLGVAGVLGLIGAALF